MDIAEGTYVVAFAEGGMEDRDLLGGKGANLAEMTRLGLPVPPGFTITTEACRVYLRTGEQPEGLDEQVDRHLAEVEKAAGRRLGDAADPLLVSVRSGAPFSMPGMMETVLNVGLNDETVLGLAEVSGDARFAWDSYRRLIEMFGRTVLGIDPERFHREVDATTVHGLDADGLKKLVATLKAEVRDATGEDFPSDPRTQLSLAIRAVFRSWNTARAVRYRREKRIDDSVGTAVNVVAMVFGNRGDDSGTGVAFTRDPSSGAQGVYGDYLADAQGEDVVAGVRNTLALPELGEIAPDVYAELLQVMERLERHYRDVCDIEFTVENGKLWLLQTRVAQPTAEAVFRIAAQLADEGLIDEDEALLRVTGAHLSKLLFPRFADSTAEPLGTGVGASPGAAVGHAVFDSPTAVEWQAQGKPVILVRRETNPDDLDGMIASKGVLTARGGKTSHAAVVARAMGTPCVCGAEGLEVDADARQAVVIGKDGDETVVAEGDLISIDGASGAYHLGALEAVPSEVSQYLDGTLSAEDDSAGELVQAVHRLLAHADSRRRLGVRANADTGEDATMARRFGAEGIGLCRTEHQFLGDRRVLIERLVLSEGDERVQVLEDLLELQREDFISLFTAMAGLPVTVRLLDPPLHEFLPDLTELSVRVALAERDGAVDPRDTALLQAVLRLHESNPMLGLRGVRLGLVVDGLFAVQTRAIAQATAALREQGMEVLPEIMLPLVGSAAELRTAVDMVVTVLKEEEQTSGTALDIPVGTMIELPRAALTAGEIAQHSEFFSFGTNDLTQTTWGISRDDAELSFLPTYLTRGIVEISPFETIDRDGVGRLVRIAVEEGRAARPGLKLGVCGEHGGDPESIAFFHDVGLDYVSCSAFRVPVARLEAGRAAVLAASTSSGSEGARG